MAHLLAVDYAQTAAGPSLLRIGFQKSASLLTLQKQQGTLEKRRGA